MDSSTCELDSLPTGPIRAVLIDLDETLYAPGAALIRAVDLRITAFIALRVGLPWQRADALRRDLWVRYGTTARGLNLLYDISERDLYAYAVNSVDPSDHVQPDRDLRLALSRIPAPRYVFTNAPGRYAVGVLDALGVRDQFNGLFAIEFAHYTPKPSRLFYERVIDKLAVSGEEVALVDDNPGNFGPAMELGLRCVQVGARGKPPAGVICVARFQDVPEALSSSSWP